MYKVIACIALLVAVIVATPSVKSINGSSSLKFGLVLSTDPEMMLMKFQPFVNILEQQMTIEYGTAIDIELLVYRTRSEVTYAISNNLIDFTRTESASYIEALAKNSELRLLGTEVLDNIDTSGGVIIVHRDSTITSLDQLRDKTFAFASDESTVGRYLAQQLLHNAGVNHDDLKSYRYMGRYDRVGYAVGSKLFTGGALTQDTFDLLVSQGVPIKELVRYPVVNVPWYTTSKMTDKLFNALTSSLITMSSRGDLSSMGISAIQVEDTENIEMISSAISQNHKFFE